MVEPLDRESIMDQIKDLNGWALDTDAITKEWTFADFKAAMAFIFRVALIAESRDHHPELFNVYNRVRLTFTTHDAGGLSQKDFDIAVEIDAL